MVMNAFSLYISLKRHSAVVIIIVIINFFFLFDVPDPLSFIFAYGLIPMSLLLPTIWHVHECHFGFCFN